MKTNVERLPKRITPCFIIAALAEIRFQTDLRPNVVPGVVYGAVRERFPEQIETPNPGQTRLTQIGAVYQPTVVFKGQKLTLHVGPRSLSLAMGETEYPGWRIYQEAIRWLLAQLQPLGVVKAPERLGLRYMDFFEKPLKDRLRLHVTFDGEGPSDDTFQITYPIRRNEFTGRVRIDSSATLRTKLGAKPGVLLDLDLGFSVPRDDFWNNAPSAFDKAHDLQKEMFFRELLLPKFLATLSPEYD